jgi:hypothetical protein
LNLKKILLQKVAQSFNKKVWRNFRTFPTWSCPYKKRVREFKKYSTTLSSTSSFFSCGYVKWAVDGQGQCFLIFFAFVIFSATSFAFPLFMILRISHIRKLLEWIPLLNFMRTARESGKSSKSSKKLKNFQLASSNEFSPTTSSRILTLIDFNSLNGRHRRSVGNMVHMAICDRCKKDRDWMISRKYY